MAKENTYDTAEEIMHAAKVELLPYQRLSIDKAGSASHEHGTWRHGADPKRSALNAWNQMHEVKKCLGNGRFRLHDTREEPHADDPGAGHARLRAPGRRNASEAGWRSLAYTS
jgi:hypothetical protein